MRVDDLLVEVRDSSLNRVGVITPEYLVGFTCVKKHKAIGSWELVLPYGHPMQQALSTAGAGLIVTINDTVHLSGPTVQVQTTQDLNDVQGSTKIIGLDDSVLLRDRLAYPTPTTADVTAQTVAYDVRSGVAETVMKQYVEANIGALAPAARQVAGLIVEGSFGRGATVKGSARFDVLYDLLVALADASDGAGTPLGFDVVQSGSGLMFQVYAPTDRSGLVRLDVANNSLTETTYSLSRPKVTRAIVGGQGDLTARAFIERTTAESLTAETVWGRRIESFVDSRDSADTTALQTAGDSALADGRALVAASVKPTDDTTMIYGRDWFLGDTVTVVIGDYELSAVVTELGLSVQADGVRLYGTIGEPKQMSYERQINAKQLTLGSRLNNLERYK